MSALYDGSTDFSIPHTPASLRVGAGVLVLALHVAFVGAFVLNKKDDKPELQEEPAVMVSVIDAPAPQQAKADPQPQPQPPTPVAQPPVPPVEQPVEQPPETKPEPEEEPPPPPVQHLEPLAPVIKPRPKPVAKPPAKPQPAAKPQEAPTPPAPAQPAAGTPEGQQQVSQAPRQADPVMVSSVEFDGARPMPVYPTASRMRREEGRVIVLVRISPQGLVDQASVDTSSGFSRLDDAALTAARQARFKPLMRNGVALAALAKLPFDFKMRN